MDAWDMDLLFFITRRRKMGRSMAITRASLHSIMNMKMRDPMIVRVEISTSSGPWWESSVISKRSPVSLFMRFPVLFLS